MRKCPQPEAPRGVVRRADYTRAFALQSGEVAAVQWKPTGRGGMRNDDRVAKPAFRRRLLFTYTFFSDVTAAQAGGIRLREPPTLFKKKTGNISETPGRSPARSFFRVLCRVEPMSSVHITDTQFSDQTSKLGGECSGSDPATHGNSWTPNFNKLGGCPDISIGLFRFLAAANGARKYLELTSLN